MKIILTLFSIYFLLLSSHTFAWNPFSNKPETTLLDPSEQSSLRVEIRRGSGNNLILKIYNGLSGPVWCESLRVTENNFNTYDVSHPFYIPSKSIEQFNVKIFDSSKANGVSLIGCKCEKIKGKGNCVFG